jgi:N-acetylmuramoyl-L-alanine amidase
MKKNMSKKTIILDPGHGMGNRRAGVFDPGACAGNHREADIVMEWANEIRAHLMQLDCRVIRTRVDNRDPAPLGQRVAIAQRFRGDIMLSIHCNAAGGNATGTETIIRHESNRPWAQAVNDATRNALHLRNRGVKTEAVLGRRLAVLAFPKCALLEIGFIDHPGDREKMLDPILRFTACQQIAQILATQ